MDLEMESPPMLLQTRTIFSSAGSEVMNSKSRAVTLCPEDLIILYQDQAPCLAYEQAQGAS